jgi:hypothetical protein
MKRLTIALALALLAGCGQASLAPQVVTNTNAGRRIGSDHVLGTWSGILTQGSSKTFNFSIHFKHDDGHSLSGTSRISVGSVFGVMAFTATEQGRTINYTETKILRQHRNYGGWCIKSATLQLSQGHKVMQGPWKSSGCIPGEIDVTRQ